MNGRHLKFEWQSLTVRTGQESKSLEHLQIKVLGIPLHAWSLDTLKFIGEKFGGYVGIDEDTKYKNH